MEDRLNTMIEGVQNKAFKLTGAKRTTDELSLEPKISVSMDVSLEALQDLLVLSRATPDCVSVEHLIGEAFIKLITEAKTSVTPKMQ